MVERARIVLASADGLAGDAICTTVGVSRPTVSLWLNRYEADGRNGLAADRPRSGRPRQLDAVEEARIVAKTLDEAPPDGGTHWSTRLMAKETGWDQATISRLWRANGLKPHQVAYVKVSTDPEFVAKLRDVVGLELSRRQLRRLAVNSVAELIAAITAYLDHRNEDPTPFVWTASVRSILAKVRKAKDTLASHHQVASSRNTRVILASLFPRRDIADREIPMGQQDRETPLLLPHVCCLIGPELPDE
jgi:transposase